MQIFLKLPVCRLVFWPLSPPVILVRPATASTCRAARLSQLTSARISEASTWTISPLAILAVDAGPNGPLEDAPEALRAPALPDARQRRVVRQGLVQAIAAEPADREVDLRLAHQPPVVDDAEQEAGQIGIGGGLAAPPLPHHRAYGSVHGGSPD